VAGEAHQGLEGGSGEVEAAADVRLLHLGPAVSGGSVCGDGAVTGTGTASVLRLPSFLCLDKRETGQDGWREVGDEVGKGRE
jgi:hypothetical protein